MPNLEQELKILIITVLNLEDVTVEDIDSNEPLFAGGLGLDSIDALELGIALQKKYAIKFKSSDESMKEHFFSVASMASFIKQHIESR